jgi:aryl-alcohol dehydrogenase-like predicted oxidoreductase
VKQRRLGTSGLMVSELCLGCMTFGRETDAGDSMRMIGRFIDAGGTFLDTADVYADGDSEEITGRAIKDVRDDLILATKVRFAMGDGPNDVGVSRKHITAACDASLRRLGTDYVDLYQVHCWDDLTPLEETLSTLSDLVRAGKVRYIGVSNFTGWQIATSIAVSEARGYERFVSLQPQYSLVERHIEYEVLPASRAGGLGILPWGPLGGGFLSGKYRRGEKPPEGSRIAGAEDDLEEAWNRRATEQNWRILDAVGAVAEETGGTYSQIALAWLLAQDGVAAPIIGARTMEQLEDNIGAADVALDDDHVRRLNEVSRPPDLYPYRFIREAQR